MRSFDRAPSPPPAHPRLQVIRGDICDKNTVATVVEGIDTVFHTRSDHQRCGASVTDEHRQQPPSTWRHENPLAAQDASVKRFVYTASNSVVMGGQRTRRRRNHAHQAVQRSVHE